MSVQNFNDMLGSLVAEALHRNMGTNYYDFKEIVLHADAGQNLEAPMLYALQRSTKVGDLIPGSIFEHIPLANVINGAEFRVMERLKELAGPTRIVMMAMKNFPYAGWPLHCNVLTLYSVPLVYQPEEMPVYQPEDQIEGAETQLEVEEPEESEESEPVIAPEYNHSLWPSPRAVRFAKALEADSRFWNRGLKPKRWSHVSALEYLAAHAKITVDELRRMRPINYMTKYLGYRGKNTLRMQYNGEYQLC